MAFTDWLPVLRKDLRAEMPTTIRGTAAQEFGVSGTENFGGYIRKEDYNPELDDWQKAVAIYDKMRRSDAMIRAMLQVLKLPLRRAEWQVNPASDDPVDKHIADFCNDSLFEDDAMEDSWDFTLRHILMQFDFGVAVLEKVWKVDEEGHYRFKRLAPRLPKTLREWHVNREGKLVAVVQYAPVPAAEVSRAPYSGGASSVRYQYSNSVSYQYLTIPAEYLAVFSLEREGDNYEGYSLLRNVYRNWYFKDQAYHIMGVGLDRWGVGIPVAALEDGHNLTEGDKEALRDILQRVRSNERAYMVTPEHVEFRIEPSGNGQGTAGTFGIQWIDHNDAQMARNVLASFLTMGRDPVGTLGFGSRLTDMFISSLDGMAKGIAADLKQYLIKPLCDYNFDMSRRKYPNPVCLDLEQVDLSALIDTMAKLAVPNGVITATDDDEAVLRKMLGLPKLHANRTRKAATEASKAPGDASTTPDQPKPGEPGHEAGPKPPPPHGGGGGAEIHVKMPGQPPQPKQPGDGL